MSLGSRFQAIFGVIAAIMLTLAAGGMAAVQLSHSLVERIYSGALVPSLDLKTVGDAYTTAAIISAVRVRVGDLSWEQGEADVRRAVELAGPAWKRYVEKADSPAEVEIVRHAQENMDEANAALNELIEIMSAQDIAGLVSFIARDMYPSVNPLLTAIGKLTEIQNRTGETVYASAMREVGTYRFRQNILLSVAVPVFLCALWLIRRRIIEPVAGMTRAMSAVAGGDLAAPIPHSGSRDEIGDLASALARFRDNARLIKENEARLAQLADALTEARDRAEDATRAKSSFLAMMSHEIRTPMNGVVTMAEMLDQTDLTEDQRDMTGIVRASSAALLTIINDILDFSKIEAGKLDIEAIEFQPAEVVEGVAELVAGRAEDRGLSVAVEIDPDTPEGVIGDPARLRQILLNLAGNAVKFTERGGVVIRVVRAGETEDGRSRLCFEVSDTGIGLTPEQRVSLFQAFRQADSSTSRKYGGTGLGLSISRKLCELMEGEIEVESVFGDGSTFRFTLPFPVSVADPVRPNVDIADVRIAAVGFLGPDQRSLVGLLAGAGCRETLWLDHDSDVVSSVRAWGARVVLLRATEAGGPALETARALASTAGDDAPAVILAAPRRLASTIAEARRLGLFCALALPFRRRRLWHVLAAAVGRAALDQREIRGDGDAVGWSPPSNETAREAGCLILVAEDNATNQVVIRRMLSRRGYAAEIVSNGVEALRKLREEGPYGLLLTDFHMPEMDGFQLTEAVRRDEAERRGVRLPIVALSADVLPGTAQRCLAAGMDGYLAKPIDSKALADVLDTHVPEARALRRRPGPSVGRARDAAAEQIDPAVFDVERMREGFGEMNAEAIEFLGRFIASTVGAVAEIETALARGDLSTAGEAAHTLKGASRSVGAVRLGQLAADIQDSIENNDRDTAKLLAGLLATTREELEAATTDLRS